MEILSRMHLLSQNSYSVAQHKHFFVTDTTFQVAVEEETSAKMFNLTNFLYIYNSL